MYCSFVAFSEYMNFIILEYISGEKFREVLTSTFGLERWLYCRQRLALRGNGTNGDTIGMASMRRRDYRE